MKRQSSERVDRESTPVVDPGKPPHTLRVMERGDRLVVRVPAKRWNRPDAHTLVLVATMLTLGVAAGIALMLSDSGNGILMSLASALGFMAGGALCFDLLRRRSATDVEVDPLGIEFTRWIGVIPLREFRPERDIRTIHIGISAESTSDDDGELELKILYSNGPTVDMFLTSYVPGRTQEELEWLAMAIRFRLLKPGALKQAPHEKPAAPEFKATPAPEQEPIEAAPPLRVCPACRYDLRGTPGHCPECGWKDDRGAGKKWMKSQK